MLAVRLRTNLDRFRRGLSDAHRKQVPFAAALAINAIGEGVQADIKASMRSTFDRPTPFTLNATYLKRARKSDLRAFVGIREFAPKGTPAWKYLGPQVTGGARGQKRFERLLQATNQGAAFAIPGPGALLDAYGNLRSGQITAILSGLGAMADRSANATVRSAGRKKRLTHRQSFNGASSFFIGRSASGKPKGVFKLAGKGRVVEVLRFTDQAPTYTARWNLKAVVLSSVAEHRKDAFSRAWAQALATAKP